MNNSLRGVPYRSENRDFQPKVGVIITSMGVKNAFEKENSKNSGDNILLRNTNNAKETKETRVVELRNILRAELEHL